jgi:circadian clock protein KaiB
VHLRLYVAGNAPNSLMAIANAKAICDEHYGLECELEIVDLMDEPLRALADEIVVTPTLLRLQPLPMLRVIGNLNDLGQVFLALGAK